MEQTEIGCPKCGSKQITANKKGFGIGKAAIGAVALGPIGLLGGLIKSGKVKITCLNCGFEWKPGENIKSQNFGKAKVEDGIATCPKCKALNPSGFDKCRRCGTVLV